MAVVRGSSPQSSSYCKDSASRRPQMFADVRLTNPHRGQVLDDTPSLSLILCIVNKPVVPENSIR